MALLDDAANPNLRKVGISPCDQLFSTLTIPLKRPHIVEAEPFADTFGPKAQRKKPRIEAGTFEELGKLGAAAADEADSAAAEAGTGIIGMSAVTLLHTSCVNTLL